jgi:ParB family chromosome partitioning protein
MTDLAFAARHSMDSPEWYTPSPIVEAARAVMGGIDLDPASHEEANRIVKATWFLTAEDDGLSRGWYGNVFVNAPGGLVRPFWMALMCAWRDRDIQQAVWIGYSLEQLQTLQNCPLTPLHFTTCIPSRRIAFVENEAKKAERIARLEAQGKVASERSSPSHAAYITYVGQKRDVFRAVFGAMGQVIA